jgi:hypothetical protein
MKAPKIKSIFRILWECSFAKKIDRQMMAFNYHRIPLMNCEYTFKLGNN